MTKPIPELTLKTLARFWGHVAMGNPDECWPWLAAKKNERGYGSFGLCFEGKTYIVSSNQVAIYLTKGWPDDPKLHSCHHCDNPPCCNGAHLFYGTHRENHQDAARKGRCALQVHPGLTTGTRSPNAKLTAEEVRFIRECGMPQAELAVLFELSQSRISLVVNRKSYLDVL